MLWVLGMLCVLGVLWVLGMLRNRDGAGYVMLWVLGMLCMGRCYMSVHCDRGDGRTNRCFV